MKSRYFNNAWPTKPSKRRGTVSHPQLEHINHTFIRLALERPHTSFKELAMETIARVEKLATTNAQIALQETIKLLQRRCHYDDTSTFDQLANVIIDRQENILHRMRYDIQRKLFILSNHKHHTLVDEQLIQNNSTLSNNILHP